MFRMHDLLWDIKHCSCSNAMMVVSQYDRIAELISSIRLSGLRSPGVFLWDTFFRNQGKFKGKCGSNSSELAAIEKPCRYLVFSSCSRDDIIDYEHHRTSKSFSVDMWFKDGAFLWRWMGCDIKYCILMVSAELPKLVAII